MLVLWRFCCVCITVRPRARNNQRQVGARYRCEYSVMGPSVNLAARLMCACDGKGVELLCNDALHDLVISTGGHAPFTFEAFDPVKVKGYNEPVVFYHPSPSAVVPGTAGRSSDELELGAVSQCYGRDEQLDLLMSPLRCLAVGGPFSLTLLSGEVGVGKTHLLTEVARRGGRGGSVVYADAKNHRDDALSAWLPLLRELLEHQMHSAKEAAGGEGNSGGGGGSGGGENGGGGGGGASVGDNSTSELSMVKWHAASPARKASERQNAHRTLRQLLPPGLRSYDVSRLLAPGGPGRPGGGPGGPRGGPGGGLTSGGAHGRNSDVEREIVVAMLCGLAALRPALLLIDGAEHLPPLAWQLLRVLAEEAPRLSVVLASYAAFLG